MKRSGQVMIIAIGILLFLAIALPTIISMTQQESRWTVKQQRTTKSYQLAESAVEHGHQKLLVSTGTWYTIKDGDVVAGFDFDATYTGVSGGEYQIKYVDGPGAYQVTILGVGRATTNDGTKDVRAVKVIYTNGAAADNAITAGGAVTLSAQVNVEWGAVISYTSVSPNGRLHPRYYSAGSITGVDTSPSLPNSDNVQWWSYDTTLPAQPQVDLQHYKTVAQSYGAAPAGCPSYYSNPGSGVTTSVASCVDTNNRTYFMETGNWSFTNPGPNFILGNVVVASGNMVLVGNAGNSAAFGVYTANIPPRAWEEYGKSGLVWSTYTCMDAYANANFPTYQDAVDADYMSAATHQIPSTCINSAGAISVHGFIYAGGGTGLTGGGNSRFHGAVITPNAATGATSNFTIYFDETVAANIRTVNQSLIRTLWQELASCNWSGANAACP